MTSITLQEKLSASGAHLGDYAGARTPVHFGDAPAEFDEVLNGCGVFDLGWRGKLIVSGEDRVRWLNGMVTNNIRDQHLNHGNYNFLLNPQGRIQGDMVVYNRGEHLLVSTEIWQVPKITETFEHFIIMDDVEVSNISDKLASLGIAGPQSRERLARAGCTVPPLDNLQVVDTEWHGIGVSIARGISSRADSYEIWLQPANAVLVWDALTEAGAVPVGSQALNWLRIVSGTPRFGVDIGERDLPQETGQSHALNFAKGCYVGQEIVERIRSRGSVHRTFAGFEVQGAPPDHGTKISVSEKQVGEITSAATVPFSTGDRTLALGYIRRENAAPGSELQAGDTRLQVSALPFNLQ
ncbi:MAG TPA: glycine cleavage T C-terminal barrel domain-containing protein [Clostridia bacterium]|nr:glycine cleavage T C-terminal barrel domain-containing protein [Clostridia bacterium]